MKWLNRIFIGILLGYKKYLSPLVGKRCRFSPTCSEYTIQAFSRYSLGKALLKSLWRILKCQPFHPGGYDPLEKHSSDSLFTPENTKKGT